MYSMFNLMVPKKKVSNQFIYVSSKVIKEDREQRIIDSELNTRMKMNCRANCKWCIKKNEN